MHRVNIVFLDCIDTRNSPSSMNRVNIVFHDCINWHKKFSLPKEWTLCFVIVLTQEISPLPWTEWTLCFMNALTPEILPPPKSEHCVPWLHRHKKFPLPHIVNIVFHDCIDTRNAPSSMHRGNIVFHDCIDTKNPLSHRVNVSWLHRHKKFPFPQSEQCVSWLHWHKKFPFLTEGTLSFMIVLAQEPPPLSHAQSEHCVSWLYRHKKFLLFHAHSEHCVSWLYWNKKLPLPQRVIIVFHECINREYLGGICSPLPFLPCNLRRVTYT